MSDTQKEIDNKMEAISWLSKDDPLYLTTRFDMLYQALGAPVAKVAIANANICCGFNDLRILKELVRALEDAYNMIKAYLP